MSTRPNARCAASRRVAIPAALDASAATPTPPIIPAVSAAAFSSMSPTTTEEPADTSALAMALPMPEPAPVTTATDPSTFTNTCLAHVRQDASSKPRRLLAPDCCWLCNKMTLFQHLPGDSLWIYFAHP